MEIVEIIGKVLFAFLFVNSGINHLINRNYLAGYVQSKRVPFPLTTTVVSGLVIIVAPILFLFNVVPVIALSVLAAFLLATAVLMHDFWRQDDEQTKTTEQIQFSKDISLLGAVLVIISLLV
jgi:uncharacterized membrane protein YphA (DoxX/SURF4 family)